MTEAIKLMRRVTAQLERNANILVMEAEAAATADMKSVMPIRYMRNSILGVIDKIDYAEAVLATKPMEEDMTKIDVFDTIRKQETMREKFNSLSEEEKKGRKGLKVTLDESAGQDEN